MIGEKIAQDYLQKKGYKILKTNYYTRRGEIDIIAQYNKCIIFENMDDEYMSGRARDIADIKDRIISKLYNEEKIDLSKLKNNTIIVAKELTTSDTAKLDFKLAAV